MTFRILLHFVWLPQPLDLKKEKKKPPLPDLILTCRVCPATCVYLG